MQLGGGRVHAVHEHALGEFEHELPGRDTVALQRVLRGDGLSAMDALVPAAIAIPKTNEAPRWRGPVSYGVMRFRGHQLN